MNLFQHSCGATGPLRLIGGAREWSLPQPFAVIGRHPAADLVLDHPQVSRRHAYLQMIQGRLFCVDLGSRTGIQWNDGLPAAWRWLEPGETLRIGPFELRAVVDEGSAALPVLSTSTRGWPNPLETGPPEPGSLLEVRRAPEAEGADRFEAAHGRLAGELTLVGTTAACGVRLPERSVSRYQCAFLRTALGVWAIDLLGRHGIAINEMGVRYGRMLDGDELRIGPFVARLRSLSNGNGRSAAAEDPAALPPFPERRSTTLATTAPSFLPASLAPYSGPLSPVAGLSPFATGDAGLDGPALSHLLGQVGMIQNQMLDSYQKSILMAVQMFATICRDELGPVRTELALAREIVEELQALKEQMESRPAGPPPAPSPPPALTPAPAGRSSRPAAVPPLPRAAGTHDVASYREMCLWLCQRAEQMDETQQARWQKILRAIVGAGGKK
jgi:pSer/pThr/pTyr-binding forkhead associated (FHA) protein